MARQTSGSSRNGYYADGSAAPRGGVGDGGYAQAPGAPEAGAYGRGQRRQQGVYPPASAASQQGSAYASAPRYPQQGAYQQAPGYPQNAYQQSGYPQQGYYQQSPYDGQAGAYAAAPRQRGAAGTRPVGYNGGSGARGGSGGRSSSPRTLLVGVLAILVGLLIGFLATFLFMNGRSGAPQPVAATLTESQLDSTVVGTYRYDGETYAITAREALLGSTSLENAANGDGTYDAPSADMVLAYARNQILAQLVADNGITVTSEEVAAYAEQTVGTSDMAAVAAYVGMDEDQALQAMTEAAAVAKLRASVAGSSSTAAPVPPTAPADGNTEVGTAEYADYIIALLGSNWDADLGTWANTDNAYYTALQNMVFAPGSASYEAAEAAYAVAYAQWQAASGDQGEAWLDYVNAYLDAGAISIATLRA